MRRRQIAQRSTVYDLYLERDAPAWFFRVIATFGTWTLLLGFICFSFVVQQPRPAPTTRENTLIVAGTALLIAGHILTIAAYLFVRSWLFRFDILLIPTITSSLIGLVALLIHQSLEKNAHFKQPVVWAPLSVALVALFISTVLAIWTSRCIQFVRSSDNRRRERRDIQYQDQDPEWRSPSVASSTGMGLLPESPNDDPQRKQFERLLSTRDIGRAVSPDAASNTYRIDLPSPYAHLQQQNLAVPANTTRIRSQSEGQQRSGWQLQNLRNLLPHGRQGAGTAVNTWKDPRERRREEIERSGFSGAAGAREGDYESWGGSPQISPPAQPNAFRYA